MVIAKSLIFNIQRLAVVVIGLVIAHLSMANQGQMVEHLAYFQMIVGESLAPYSQGLFKAAHGIFIKSALKIHGSKIVQDRGHIFVVGPCWPSLISSARL